MLDVLMCIFKDILSAFRYLPYGIVIGGIAYLVLSRIYKERIENYKNKAGLILFIVYIVVVLYLTILSREAGSRDAVMLNVFQTVSSSPQSIAYVVENLMLFMPYGFLLPMLWKRFIKIKNILAAGFLSSLSIEVIQLITGTGFFQTDDLIMNTFGTFVGFWAYLGCIRIGHRIRTAK